MAKPATCNRVQSLLVVDAIERHVRCLRHTIVVAEQFQGSMYTYWMVPRPRLTPNVFSAMNVLPTFAYHGWHQENSEAASALAPVTRRFCLLVLGGRSVAARTA